MTTSAGPSADEVHEPRVDIEIEGGTATLTLVNPRRKNAITMAMAARIADFCATVETDPTIGAVIVAGAGSYFCSGADTRDLAVSSGDAAGDEAVARTSAVYGVFTRIGSLPVPTVAAVAGGAVGAGMNLALAADLLLVTPDAKLDSGFLARSIHPGGGHLSLLGRAAGERTATAMGLFGLPLSGTEAVARGLAWAAVDPQELLPAARSLTALPAADPALARWIKRSAALELGPAAVPWQVAVEVERGAQMWSLARKGSAAWSGRGPVRAAGSAQS